MNRTKVRRRVLACARCRKRKLSCDGKVPACTRCIEAKVPCVGFDSSTQQEAPRSIADFLEAHIAELSQRPPPQSNATIPSPPESHQSDVRSSQWQLEKCTFAGSLANKVMEDITPAFLGISSAMPLLQCVVKGTQIPSKRGPIGSGDLDENHPRSILNPAPAKDLFQSLMRNEKSANQLLENYLERVITQYPIYHRNDVTAAFNSIYHRTASAPKENSLRNRYIVCLIMAISLSTTARNHVQQANESAHQLVQHAMQWLPDVATNDIAGLQAYLLLTQYIFLNPRIADLWLLTGLISQAVIDLGLHQELPNSARVSVYERDMRRRLFWCAWEMEVGVCCIFRRPTSLPIRQIEVGYPLEVDDTSITRAGVEPGGEVTKFTQRIICRFRKIEAEIIAVLEHNEPVPREYASLELWTQGCIAAMNEWQREIKASRDAVKELALAATYTASQKASRDANRDSGLLARWNEMCLYTDIACPYILVCLHRTSKRIKEPTTEQTMIALENAVKVAEGYFRQSEAEPGKIKYVFHPCHHVFNCAIVYLEGLQRCMEEVAAKFPWHVVEDQMDSFRKCLSSISERWGAAKRCLEEYERLLLPIRKVYWEYVSVKTAHMGPGSRRVSVAETSTYDSGGSTTGPPNIHEAARYFENFPPTATTADIEGLTASYADLDWNATFLDGPQEDYTPVVRQLLPKAA